MNTECIIEEIYLLFLETTGSCNVRKPDIEKMFHTCINKKSILNKKLLLNQENGWRKYIEISDPELNGYFYKLNSSLESFILNHFNVSKETISFEWLQNRVKIGKQEVKISKIIKKYLDEIINKARKHNYEADYDNIFKLMYSEEFTVDEQRFLLRLQNLQLFLGLSEYKVEINRIIENVNSFKKLLVISTNPYDFYTASYNASFSSCFRPDGDYCSSINAFVMDDVTLIAFIISKDEKDKISPYKIGRIWVHVDYEDGELDKVVLGRRYGTFPDSAYNQVVNEIETAFGDCDLKSKEDFNAVEVEGEGEIYIDRDGVTTLYYRRSCKERCDSEESTEIIIKAPCCLYCGDISDNGRSWLCSDCNPVVFCSHCDTMILSDEDYYTTVNGDIICSRCLNDDYYICVCCDEIYPCDSSDISLTLDTSEPICIHCVEDSSDFFVCDLCGGVYTYREENDVSEVEHSNYSIVCNDCYDNYFHECERCGVIIADDYEYCDDCENEIKNENGGEDEEL